MKKQTVRYGFFIALVLSILMVLNSCAPVVENLPEKKEITCVSLVPSITETIYALGKFDSLIGVDVNSNYPKETEKLAKVGDFNGPDIEKIVALAPDIVFAGSVVQDSAVASLKSMGFNVIQAEPSNVEEIYSCITLIGETLDAAENAKKLNADIAKKIEETKEKSSRFTKNPVTYYAMSYGDLGNWTCGEGSFINEILAITGATPALNSGERWLEINLEQIVKINPEIILVAGDVGNAQAVSALNGYRDTSAVKNNHVYLINADFISRPGPRIVDAIDEIYNIMEKYNDPK